MRILVTGKNGQVGSSLMLLGDSLGFSMIGMSSTELDVTNIKNVDAVVAQVKPDLVINASAYTAVDKAESDMQAAYAINETGPKLLAKACKKLDIPIFHISTDYVFDGQSDSPYEEDDLVNPVSVYGRSKLMGELAVRSTQSKHVILRTSWVFSEFGNNFVKTMLRLFETRDHLTVVADQIGGPTSSYGIAKVLLAMAAKYRKFGTFNWGIYHFCQKPYVSWYDFARVILERVNEISSLDCKVDIKPISSAEYPTPVLRPSNSCLSTSKLEKVIEFDVNSWCEDLELVLRNHNG
jgi:dTDP-4-dehydrorhamnose reductase